MKRLSLSMIQESSKVLHKWFLPTPIEYSDSLSNLLKVPVIFKCEHLQPSGSVKLRGTYYILSQLTDQEKKQGVCTYDSHNHALSLAYAANLLNIPCTIYLSESPSSFFEKKIKDYQAYIKFCLCENEAISDSKREEKTFVSSYDDDRLMAGNGGSLGIELLKDIPQIKNVIVPIGRGDLIGGLLFFLKKKYPDIVIIGCDYLLSSTKLSYETELYGPRSQKASSLINKYLDYKTTHDHEALLDGLKWLLKTHNCLIEPSAAITIAACLSTDLPHLEGPTAVILSGKSFDDQLLARLFI